MKHVAPVVTLFVMLTSTARADVSTTVVVPSLADATIYESSEPVNLLANGRGSGFFAGRTGQSNNSIRRGLIRFDLANRLPAGVTITNVTIRLWQGSSNAAPETVTVHRLLESWDEGLSVAAGNGGSGTPALPADVTWFHQALGSFFWTTPGGTFQSTPSAQAVVAGDGFWEWTSPTLVQDVERFRTRPVDNTGWIFLGNESEGGTSKRFASREEPDSNLRPQLIITYLPTPASVAALAPILLVGATRRRTP